MAHDAARRRHGGFTLTELIIVLVILGIVLAITIPRFAAKQDYSARGYAEALLAAVHYAQKYAISSGCDVQVSVDAAGYSLMQRGSLTGPGCSSVQAFTAAVHDPALQDPTGAGTQAYAGTTPNDVTVSGGFTLYFDKLGRPCAPASGSVLTAAASAAVASPEQRWTLTVEPESGYAHL